MTITMIWNITNKTAKISNLREINWQSFDINFFVIFSPGILENSPFSYLATIKINTENEAKVFNKITETQIAFIQYNDSIKNSATAKTLYDKSISDTQQALEEYNLSNTSKMTASSNYEIHFDL